ncbi:MAG: hypothetical protein QOF68_2567, partial [Gaiellales bacterium]|nr:hypothetical protein [Gaiellales bacterium]
MIPETTSAVTRSAFDVWKATLTGTAEYWTRAAKQRATPVDVALDG